MLAAMLPAAAQDAGLRGAVDETAINHELLPNGGGIPAPQYEPAGPGTAATGTETTGSIFDEAPLGAPLPRPPTTARDRTEERRLGTAPATAEPTEDFEEDAAVLPMPTVDVEVETGQREQATAARAEAIQNLDRPEEENPFAPVGLRLGSFDVFTSLEQGLTATNNADFSTTGGSAILSETTLRLNAVSDWATDEARLNGYGTYRTSISGQDLDEGEVGIDASARFEIGNELEARGALGYLLRPESAASPVIIEDTIEQPYRQTFSATAGVEKGIGKARFAIDGEIAHDAYGDADLAGGGTLSQSDRDATLYAMTLRGGYEVTAVFTPFLEGEIGRLQYDETVDASGYERSGDRYAMRAGLEIDGGEKLSGEFAAGYVEETFDDDRLTPITGPSLEASMNWSPVRGTSVNLWGGTFVEGTTNPGESGSLLYLTRLTLQREMRANLTGALVGGVGYRDYSSIDAHDWLFNAEANATWWFNRNLGLTGRAQYDAVRSTLPDRDTDTASIFLGLKLQR